MNLEEYQAQVGRECLAEYLANDPIASYRIKVPVTAYIRKNTDGKCVNGTIREVSLTSFLIDIKEQSIPDYFSNHQARLLNPKYSGSGRVPRDVALEYIAEHFHMTPDELVERIESIRKIK